MKNLPALSLAFVFALSLQAQSFYRDTSVQVYSGSQPLKNAWAGGHNTTQSSAIDLNFDGTRDLVVFDLTTNNYYDKITTYINTGTPNQVSYVHAPQYEKKFPFVHNWMLLADYNNDGKEDLFTYNVGGFSVYKNTSSNGNLQFTLVTLSAKTKYQCCPNLQTLYVSPADLPAFGDINHDGDLDVLAYDISGVQIYYYENLSMERYGIPDSLCFWEYSNCWGHFTANSSNNTIYLQTCAVDSTLAHPGDQRMQQASQHSGNCLMCLDMDNDADQDLLTGSIGYCNMMSFTNGLDSSVAEMTAYDPNYPSANVPVDQSNYPCPYHIDVNNDGRRDLLVSPNSSPNSVNQKSIMWYRNTGTEQNPVFTFQQDDFLQDGMIETGEGAFPAFIDINADGLKDLVIGNAYVSTATGCINTKTSSLFAYLNTGTANAPKFQFLTDDYASLTTQLPGFYALAPCFGDIDNDGDADMITGDDIGHLHLFLNTAGPSAPPVFILQSPIDMTDAASAVMDVGYYSMPQLFDMNQDSLPDLVVGERSGKLYYYQNVGTATAPDFALITNFLGSVDVEPACCTGYAAPFLYLDNNSIEMFVGTESGRLFHYTNISGNLSGTFTLSDSLFWQPAEVWEGQRLAPSCTDLDNDGYLDMVVGNYRGGAAFYRGTFPSGAPSTYPREADVRVYPNPAQENLYVSLTGVFGRTRLGLCNVLGEELLTWNMEGAGPLSLDVKGVAPGTYYLRINAVNCTAVKKVIITR